MFNRIVPVLSLSLLILTMLIRPAFAQAENLDTSRIILGSGWGRDIAVYQPTAEEENALENKADSLIQANPRGVLDLRQVYALALQRNPELKGQAWQVGKAQAQKIQAGSRLRPEVSVGFEDFLGSGDYFGTRELQTTLELSQRIELGKKRPARLAYSDSKIKLATWEFETQRVETMHRAKAAFVEVVAAQREVANADSALHLSEQMAAGLDLRAKAGRVSSAEAARATIGVGKARIDREWALRQLDEAREKLAAIWGDDEPVFASAHDQLDTLGILPAWDTLLAVLPEHPALKQAEFALAAEAHAVAYEQSLAKPDLTVSGGVRLHQAIENHALVASIGMPLPFKGAYPGKVLEAKRQLAQSRTRKEVIRLALRGRLAEAYAVARTARTEIAMLTGGVLSGAQSVYRAMQDGYLQGRYNSLEVLDAQKTLIELRQQHVRALADYHLAIAEIEALCGQTLNRAGLAAEGVLP